MLPSLEIKELQIDKESILYLTKTGTFFKIITSSIGKDMVK